MGYLYNHYDISYLITYLIRNKEHEMGWEMRASLGTILDFYPVSSNLRLRFDKTSSLSFRSWGRRALASDQSQAIKLVNISQLVHFSITIRCQFKSLCSLLVLGGSHINT